MALRKLSESLNDILDHDSLVQAYRQRAQQQSPPQAQQQRMAPPQQWPGGVTGYQVPHGGLTR
ncbi:hypothetical protein ABT282_07560 [Streptomyces sp. NPDC000927]|uniref:hypothetical protein n=1 Tax=Streptomyces sp. NPDC000927 TaxID=3154371 RepID=UPI003316B397